MAITDRKVIEAREKLLEQIREKHPRAILLSVEPAPGTEPGEMGGDVIGVTPPTRAQWRKFKVVGMDQAKRPDVMEMLLRDCLVYPEPTAFEALVERRPGLIETFGEEVLELGGAGLVVEKNA